MTTPVFAPRFALGEEVRLCTTVQEPGTTRTFPHGVTGHVLAVANGVYDIRTSGLYGGYELRVQEAEMEEAKLAPPRPPLPEGAGVQGIVERAVFRTHAGAPVAFVVLQGRREVFVLHARGFEEELALQLTRIGDKVRFVITEADESRPRGNAFCNLGLC